MTNDDAWQAVRRVRTYEHVLGQIAERILDGRLNIGDRLPSERDLVAALGVSRSSVREALRILEAMGIVEAHVGSGRDSGSRVSGRATEALSNLLRLHMALSHFQLADLVEVRIQLERSAAERASAEAHPDDISRLNALIDQMLQPDIAHGTFHELDGEFHVTIARASHNALAADLMQALRDAVRAHMEVAFSHVDDWDGMVKTLSDEHRQIAAAIANGEGDLAAELVSNHIAQFYERTSDAEAFAANLRPPVPSSIQS